MCPGGYVVNSSSEEGGLCVNGMSYSGRDSGKANKREDIQKPAESKVVAENSAAAETERTVS